MSESLQKMIYNRDPINKVDSWIQSNVEGKSFADVGGISLKAINEINSPLDISVPLFRVANGPEISMFLSTIRSSRHIFAT